MKNKLFLTTLFAIGLCLFLSCGIDIDTTSESAARDIGTTTMSGVENIDVGVVESEQQFFRNQNRSLSILDEAMRPFRKEAGERTIESGDRANEESELYCDSFAGVFIDKNGNLNIGVVQRAVTRQAEISMNSLRGQVIYRQDAFSYNYLQQIRDAIVPLISKYEISIVGIDEYSNSVRVSLTNEINAESVIRHLRDIGLYEEAALTFVVEESAILEQNNGPIFGGDELLLGTAGVNAMCNDTGRLGVLTNQHIAPVGTIVEDVWGVVIGKVPSGKAKNGGTIDAAFIPFNDTANWLSWEITPHARYGSTTYTNIKLGNNIKIVYGMKIRRIGQNTKITNGTVTLVDGSCLTDNGILKTNTFEYSNAGKGGDSGGPVYYNDGTNLYLIGLHFSSTPVNILGIPVSEDLRIGYACRIGNVMSELNVTPITYDTYKFTNVGSNVTVTGLNISRNDYPRGRLTIPGQFNGRTVTEIDAGTFQGRTGISAATIPNTVTRVGGNAFLNTGIWSNTANNDVVYADKWAVGYRGTISNLSGELTLSQNTAGIGDYAFAQVLGLKGANIPGSVTYIGTGAFSNNSIFERVWIPSSAITIGSMAFSDCPALTMYVQANSRPSGWQTNWNYNRPVIWGSPAAYINSTSEFGGGLGTESNPFIISTMAHLNNLRNYNGHYYKLGNNISLQNTQWTPIPEFNGHLDGNGYTISNLNMTFTNSLLITNNLNNCVTFGLFALNRGTIRNLNVTANINLTANIPTNYSLPQGREIVTGVIAAVNHGTIQNTTVSASGSNPMINSTIPVYNVVGGIAGYAYATGNITSCTNNGAIHSSGNTGGIIGINFGTPSACVNNGTINYTYINDNRGIGGIVGVNSGVITSGTNNGTISYANSSNNSNLIQPSMAHIAGRNSYGSANGAFNFNSGHVNRGALQTVTYTSGGVTQTHNQALYVGSRAAW